MNTWLPQIMREAGYSLGSALSFLLALNLNGILVAPLAGAAADRFGSKPITAPANHYSLSSRATGLGWALGIGRTGAISGPIFGGLILGSQLGFEWSFYAFAIAAMFGAIIISLVPRSSAAGAATAGTRAMSSSH